MPMFEVRQRDSNVPILREGGWELEGVVSL